MEVSTDAAEIKRNGWRQGSIVSALLASQLKTSGCIPGDHDLYIVTTHDCDVTHSSFTDEPFVELLGAKTAPTEDKSYLRGKSPRRLHFWAVKLGEDAYYLAEVRDLYKCPRNRLLGHTPDHSIDVLRSLGIIRSWLSKRYVRASFPDEFNRRIQGVPAKLKKKFKRDGDLISGIYLSVVDAEYADGQDYSVTAWSVMDADLYEDTGLRSRAQAVANEIEAALAGCAGIDITESHLISDDNFSLRDLSNLKRWDFDELSNSDQ